MLLSDIKGIKSKRLEILNNSGIYTPVDLISFFPKRYIDLNRLSDLRKAKEGEDVLILARTEEDVKVSYIKKNMNVVKAKFVYDNLNVYITYFNQPYMAKNIVKSYEQLPCMVYQIQTKFRDEARPRAGLIRVREFTMKDAYSFHTSQEDLEKQYYRVYDAYFNIYKRLGLKNVISVASDTGMMGGKVAHEFMLLSDMGEDSIAICDCCDYRANVEVAKGVLDKVFREREELKEVYTGDAKSIDEVCELLNIKNTQGKFAYEAYSP